MERIEKPLREVENMLVFLTGEMPEPERALLLPVLSSHLETINRWKIAKLGATP